MCWRRLIPARRHQPAEGFNLISFSSLSWKGASTPWFNTSLNWQKSSTYMQKTSTLRSTEFLQFLHQTCIRSLLFLQIFIISLLIFLELFHFLDQLHRCITDSALSDNRVRSCRSHKEIFIYNASACTPRTMILITLYSFHLYWNHGSKPFNC